MGKRTPLYNKHLVQKAKMVDFGGWDMPLHYGSQMNEHHQVRRDAGVFDVSHMTIIDLTGQRVREFLRYLLANDVERLKKTGKALYSCMLNDQGGVLDDLIVYFQDEHQFRMVVNAATRDKDIAWITKQAKPFAVQVRERDDFAMLAVQGSQVRKKLEPLLPANLSASVMALAPFYATWHDDEFFIARTGYTGEEGFEIILPAQDAPNWWDALLAAGIAPIGLGARDTLRLEAGMNLYGADMDENYSPLESGLAWTVAFKPADRVFIGRSALETQRNRGNHSILVGLVLPVKGILRGHQTVSFEGGGVGQITSGTFSPTLGGSIAFARLPAGEYKQVTVTIRNKPLLAKVVTPPFVRHGKTCISFLTDN
ncbi:MAG: glycine cleavage system aminomethyltransferase GcvT [Gammaproteobacteria bacterium]|nr:MAG: glycine cleavage system aminomethyltransferase GcvT [Gammaproteobacteria bacterium]RKZ74444.1 MAG: glycine cleavage system aminomethyltransferase GcvT [Gammaproteobacteria bacterium]